MNKYIQSLYCYKLCPNKKIGVMGINSIIENVIYEYEAYCFDAMLAPPIISLIDWLVKKVKENE